MLYFINLYRHHLQGYVDTMAEKRMATIWLKSVVSEQNSYAVSSEMLQNR